MDISVPIVCSDKTIELPLKKLLKYRYFDELLSKRTITKIYHNSSTDNEDKNEIENKFVSYTISVPYISVECSSEILLRLVTNKYDYMIHPYNYTDELIEIMMYNAKFGTGLKLMNSTWGLNIKQYFDMIVFIKQKLPTVNAYYFLEESGFWFPSSFIEHSFELCAQNKLDSILIEDLLSYLSRYLLISKTSCFDCNKRMLSVLDTIVNCCGEYKHIIERKVNDELIKNFLRKFVKNNEFYCSSDYYYNKQQKIIDYNEALKLIFEDLRKIANYGIINMNNIGTIQEFQVY